MREILFRGKAIDGNWYYGVPLVFTEDYVCITAPHTYNKTVFPETVGQYTGLTDKNGKKIFEGDVVRNVSNNNEYVGVVEYSQGAFGMRFADRSGCFLCIFSKSFGIIGNIHDNPELGGDTNV